MHVHVMEMEMRIRMNEILQIQAQQDTTQQNVMERRGMERQIQRELEAHGHVRAIDILKSEVLEHVLTLSVLKKEVSRRTK